MRKLTRETLADRLLAELERQILAGRIAVGEALPNERELSEAFGVGRTTVREAIQGLLAVGLVNRVGKALIVSDFMGLGQEELGLASLASRISIEEVYETRKLIEVKAVRLAAKNRSRDDLLRLRSILQQMDTVDVEQYHKADADFHTAIVFASGNSVLSQVYESSQKLFFKLPSFWKLFSNRENTKSKKIGSGIKGHLQIYEAIEATDAVLAEKLMFDHLDQVKKDLLKSIEHADLKDDAREHQDKTKLEVA